MLVAALFTPAGLAGLALGLLSSGAAPAVAAEINTPVVSGLRWRSGASVDSPFVDFAGWRGRRLDANVLFISTQDSWAGMTQWFNGLKSMAGIRRSPLPAISLPMLPGEAAKQFGACARGDFDGDFRQYGEQIAAAGAGHAVVRLGWEANKTRPWSPSTAADIPDYVTCFQREAAALRSTAPSVKIEWAMGRISAVPFDVMDMYPGNAHVDVIGVHYYDNVAPKIATQAAKLGQPFAKVAKSAKLSQPLNQLLTLTVEQADPSATGSGPEAALSLLGKLGSFKSLVAKKPKDAKVKVAA